MAKLTIVANITAKADKIESKLKIRFISTTVTMRAKPWAVGSEEERRRVGLFMEGERKSQGYKQGKILMGSRELQ